MIFIKMRAIYHYFDCVFVQFFKANLIKNDILRRLIFIDFSGKEYIYTETVGHLEVV